MVLLFTLGWVESLISGHVNVNIVSVQKFVNQVLVVDLIEVFVCVCNLTVNLYLHSKHSKNGVTCFYS